MSRLRLGLVVIAYNQPVWTERLVASALTAESHVAVHLFLHSNEHATRTTCEELAGRPAAQDDHVVFFGMRHVSLLRNGFLRGHRTWRGSPALQGRGGIA